MNERVPPLREGSLPHCQPRTHLGRHGQELPWRAICFPHSARALWGIGGKAQAAALLKTLSLWSNFFASRKRPGGWGGAKEFEVRCYVVQPEVETTRCPAEGLVSCSSAKGWATGKPRSYREPKLLSRPMSNQQEAKQHACYSSEGVLMCTYKHRMSLMGGDLWGEGRRLLAKRETDFALCSVAHCCFKKKKRPGVLF